MHAVLGALAVYIWVLGAVRVGIAGGYTGGSTTQPPREEANEE